MVHVVDVDAPDALRTKWPKPTAGSGRKSATRASGRQKARASKPKAKTPCARFFSACRGYRGKLARLQRKGLVNLKGDDMGRYAGLMMQTQLCGDVVRQVRQLDLYLGEGSREARDLCRTVLKSLRSL